MEHRGPIIAISVAVVVLAAVIVSVIVIADQKDGDENGLDGKYFYIACGTFEDDSIEYTKLIGYNGNWEIGLDGGVVTCYPRTLNTTANTSYTNIEVASDLVFRHNADYAGVMSEKNGLIKGAEYIGDTVIDSTYYGALETSVFVNGDSTYYVGENGVVYRAIFEDDNLTDEDVPVVYELISVIGDI